MILNLRYWEKRHLLQYSQQIQIPYLNNRGNHYRDFTYIRDVILIIEKFSESNSEILADLAKKYKVLINPLKSINITKEFLRKYNLGLHLYGSDEIRPGFKDYDSLSSVLDEI